ncbi:MAG: hypothetical protein IPH82_29110 [Chloroflexi bacterium]|nr:hypothetical protein [Chloroflexota bacterium]
MAEATGDRGFVGLGVLAGLTPDEWMRVFIANTRNFNDINLLAQELKIKSKMTSRKIFLWLLTYRMLSWLFTWEVLLLKMAFMFQLCTISGIMALLIRRQVLIHQKEGFPKYLRMLREIL